MAAFINHDFKRQRADMIQGQIIMRGVKDERVIAAMAKIPRHLFIPQENRSRSYDDSPVSIGYGQTISQPYIVALMTELLDLSPGDKVLEIGTGSGYQAAVLGEIVREVFTIEIIPELGTRAEKILAELNYTNISVRVGDGYFGWTEHAPFDAIIVTAAPPFVPPALMHQLKAGGRLVIPVGDYPYQELKKYTKSPDGISEQSVIPVLFVPMTGEAQKNK